MSEENKRTARAVFEIWSTGDVSRLDAFVAPHVVHHDSYDAHAAEGLDTQLIVEDQIAEGQKVVTRWRGEMTHLGELRGIAATGRRVIISGITIDRFEDGKIVEAWRSLDYLDLLRGIGAFGRT